MEGRGDAEGAHFQVLASTRLLMKRGLACLTWSAGLPAYWVCSSYKFFCFLKCSKTCYNTFVPASSQEVSPSTHREPELPAPQAILRSDEATPGTSVIKRRASLRRLMAALCSRSITNPQ